MRTAKRWMGRWALVMLVMSVLAVIAATAGDAVEPAMLTITNKREEAVTYASAVTYYTETTLLLTNCVLYSGTTTNSARQDLDEVTVTVSAGNATTNVDYAATVNQTNPGLWSASITVPGFVGTPNLQIKITDGQTNTYIYPWKQLRTTDSM